MDAIGVVMIGAGTTLVAIGAGNMTEARRVRVAFAAGPSGLGVRF